VDQVLDDERAAIDAYWRAANYVSVGQIYLMHNPLLRETLLMTANKPCSVTSGGASRYVLNERAAA
jgi:phosphoketolase